MELFQDLQKHFQSLVFNINMQYGNMVSMHDFFESCQTFVPLFSDFVDLFDLVSDRCNELEDENQRFRSLLVEINSRYSHEIRVIKKELQEIKTTVQQLPQHHVESSAQLFQIWVQTISSLERDSEKMINNMWRSNQDVASKLRHNEKELDNLTSILNQVRQERDTLLDEIKRKDEAAHVREQKLSQLTESVNQLDMANKQKEETIIDKRQERSEQMDLNGSLLRIGEQEGRLQECIQQLGRIARGRLASLRDEHERVKNDVKKQLGAFVATMHGMISQHIYHIIQENMERVQELESKVATIKMEKKGIEKSLNDTLKSYQRIVFFQNRRKSKEK